MKRSNICFAWLSFLLFYINPHIASSQEAQGQNRQHDFDKAYGFGLEIRVLRTTLNHRLGTFSNLPIQARTIPSHRNDSWIMPPGTPRIVPDDAIYIKQAESFGFTFMPQYTFRNILAIRGGVNVFFSTPTGMGTDGNDHSREINQYGTSETGYGTSLVYYSVQNKSFWAVKPTVELELRIQKYIAVLGGYTQDKGKLQIETGYDRWAAIEKYKAYPLAKIVYSHLYVGIKIGSPIGGLVVFVSVLHPIVTLESGMQDVQINLSTKRYTYGTAMYFGINNYKDKH